VKMASSALFDSPAAVFFDLDGTLADTARDLSEPINAMRRERGLDPLPLEVLRPFASAGARGLIGRGLGVDQSAPEFAALRDEFLARYESAICVHTQLFEGIGALLETLESHRCPWGVVSNKVERYVRPILARLGLESRSVVTVGGDTTGHAKPHPAPLLHAARKTGVEPKTCLYIGDDLRDIQAGQAAGMKTVAAAYGFCGEAQPAHTWGADALVEHPQEIAALIRF
jgi:N-acetyl-D-muramate 6-phosphate phosphatase